MITVITIILSIFGFFLFSRGGMKRGVMDKSDYTWVNHLGGLLLLLAAMGWFFIIASLLVSIVNWLWRNAP